MDKTLVETLDVLAPLIDEMGEERLAEYCKCYLLMNLPKDKFYFSFREYVESRDRISLNSFKDFLIRKNKEEYNKELSEIMRNINEHNKKETDWHDD